MTSILDEQAYPQEKVSDKILTAPNVVTFIRLLLIPLFLWLLFGAKQEVAALVVFAIASCTDWVDGQLARRTNQVSKLGKLLDPLVDRFLLAAGVIAIVLLGRLPLWILVYIILRDCILLIEGRIMLALVNKVPPVVYLGKFATAFLMIGFCLLLLGMPEVPSLGLANTPVWLPGFGTQDALLGIWFVYAGLICSISVFVVYQVNGVRMVLAEKRSAD